MFFWPKSISLFSLSHAMQSREHTQDSLTSCGETNRFFLYKLEEAKLLKIFKLEALC